MLPPLFSKCIRLPSVISLGVKLKGDRKRVKDTCLLLLSLPEIRLHTTGRFLIMKGRVLSGKW